MGNKKDIEVIVKDFISNLVNVGEIRKREINNEEADNFALTCLREWAKNGP